MSLIHEVKHRRLRYGTKPAIFANQAANWRFPSMQPQSSSHPVFHRHLGPLGAFWWENVWIGATRGLDFRRFVAGSAEGTVAPMTNPQPRSKMPRLRAHTAAFPLLILALMSSTARAERSDLPPEVGYNYGDVEDARWAATSGALRAAGNGLTGVWGNPASLAQSQVYHVGAIAGIWPEAKRQSYGIAAMDSVTARLAAGLGFVWSDQDPDGIERQSQDLRLALAYPFSPQVSFGITGRYLNLKQDGLGPLGQSYASGGLQDEAMLETFSFDAGLRVQPSENVSFGVLGSNLSNPGNGLQPTSVGGGLGVGTREFFIEADVLADFTTWQKTTTRAMGGAEFLAGGNFPLRLGYRYDGGLESHAISGGLGYVDPTFSVEFGARRSVSGEEYTALVFTVQYFVESSGITRAPSPAF